MNLQVRDRVLVAKGFTRRQRLFIVCSFLYIVAKFAFLFILLRNLSFLKRQTRQCYNIDFSLSSCLLVCTSGYLSLACLHVRLSVACLSGYLSPACLHVWPSVMCLSQHYYYHLLFLGRGNAPANRQLWLPVSISLMNSAILYD